MKPPEWKKPYSPPTLTKLTPEQAQKLVADRTNCSEEEASDFLKSLRKQPPQDATDQKPETLSVTKTEEPTERDSAMPCQKLVLLS